MSKDKITVSHSKPVDLSENLMHVKYMMANFKDPKSTQAKDFGDKIGSLLV